MSTWALVGSPNCGKTTLYNWLTGAKSKVVNYPGSTVEYNSGPLREPLAQKHKFTEALFVDTPGIYSLQAQSEDEEVTYNILLNTPSELPKITGVVLVLDATQLERHLKVAKQVLDSGFKILFVLSMRDLLEKEKAEIDLDFLKKELKSEVLLFDGVLGKGLDEIVSTLQKISEEHNLNTIRFTPETSLHSEWSQQIAKRAFKKSDALSNVTKLSDKLDSLLLHPVFGFLFFFIFMTLLFSSIYWLAQPFMEGIDAGTSYLIEKTLSVFSGQFGDFLANGLVAAIGGTVIFIPQIFILFLGIGILESSGYLARVSALMDKPLALVGLGGRSFVPLLSGFACAIPAIMATRNIASKKERLLAQCIIPFMTCSARLPVYALLIGFLWGEENALLSGFILTLLYFGAIIIGAVASKVLTLLLKDSSKPRLIMELPLYRLPKLKAILLQAVSKSKMFLYKAGPIIVSLAIVLWFATNFPKTDLAVQSSTASSAILAQQSYAAQVGKFLEPVFKPMGLDWRVGFGIISAFAAREVFVSSLTLMFNIEADSEETQMTQLKEAMKTAQLPDGTPLFNLASGVGLLVFFMIALQCTSTVGILKKETGSWKMALLQLFFSNALAYGLAVACVTAIRVFSV